MKDIINESSNEKIMEIPKYPDLVQATFEALVELDGCGNIEDINNKICEILNLDESLKTLKKEGKNGEYPVLDTYLRACRSWLRNYGALQKIGPSTWEITPKFQEFKTLSPDICKDIYIHYRGSTKTNVEIEKLEPQTGDVDEIQPEDIDEGKTKSQEIIEESRSEVHNQLLKDIREMDELDFEKLVIKLFQVAYHFTLETTPKSHDHGLDAVGKIDLLGGKASIDIAIQCKRYGEKSSSISSKAISEFRGSLDAGYKGIFVSTVGYSSDAKTNAEDPKKGRISLVDGDTLVDLLIDNEVGCYRVYQLDEEEFAKKKKKK